MGTRGQKLGVFVAAVSLIAAGISVKSQVDTEHGKAALKAQNQALTQFVACQSDVNDQLVKALQARTTAADSYNDALNKLINSLFSAKTQEEAASVYSAWKAKLAQTAADRAAHPYPDPPSNTCGTAPRAPR
jgi:hypothetical protein